MTETSQVRVAVAEDLPEVVAADHIAASGDASRIAFLTDAVAMGACRVLVERGHVAGFVVIRLGHFFGRDFVDLLMVHPRHRRKGIGRCLLRAVVNAGATRKVFTSTNESNQPMRALLDGEGWTFSGELTGLDDNDPELVFFIERP